MKTAALDAFFDTSFDTSFDRSFDTPFSLELPARLSLHRPVAGMVAVVEPEPVCWRSEAFAEDLVDLVPATVAGTGAAPRHPLLRRALAVVLRRR